LNACYFDTSVFLAILNGESSGPGIRALLRELKTAKTKIYTSIITVQETSVEAIRNGGRADELLGQISKLARIQTITREIALKAALLEGQVIARMKASDLSEEERIGLNRRRKWDCFHIATAIDLGCAVLYSQDTKMINRKLHLSLKGMEFLEPLPSAINLFPPDEDAPGLIN
jgi:predicted nucleic acid-binding protein